jgi:ABC-2 type transport system permease protein
VSADSGYAVGTPVGSIYDLGYRHYEGKRYGRLYATWSLYVESLRGIWGFGRPATAKAAPFILLGLYSFFAVMQLAFSSFISQAIASGEDVGELFAYDTYFSQWFLFVLMFCIAQAPELVCRDQRYSVLPLYFTRSLHRVDYVLAKLAALASALFILLMVPMIALFVGDVLMQKDTIKAIGDELPKALPVLPACFLTAASLATTSLAIASFSPRRAYAAISLLAYVLIYEAVAGIVWGVGNNAGWGWADKPQLFAPLTSLMGATYWFFGKVPNPDYGFPTTLGAEAYVLSALALMVGFGSVLLFRYRRLAA